MIKILLLLKALPLLSVFFIGSNLLITFTEYYIISKLFTLNLLLFIAFIITLFLSIKSNKNQINTLVKTSITDELTGLNNRKGLKYVEGSINTLKGKWACFYFDLDELKKINDNFGHEAGDQYILGFSQVLKSTFRHKDLIFRIGGDEFVVFTDIVYTKDVKVILQRLNEHSKRRKFKVSIGINIFNYSKPFNIKNIINTSDERMYKNKLYKRKYTIKRNH